MTSGTWARPPVEVRLWSRVDRNGPGGCWVWLGAVTSTGYGTIRRDGRKQYVHRVSYELNVGPIPEGLQIDHLCRNRVCVNPAHLEPVTPETNVRRGNAPMMVVSRSGRCKRGHDLTITGYVRPDGKKGRNCTACARELRQQRAAS